MKILKNIKWATLLIGILFGTFACDDVLDVVPSDKVNIDRILNKGSVTGFRDNSYNHLSKTFASDFSAQMLNTYTDDAFRAGTGTPYQWHDGQLTLSKTMFTSGLWNQYWQGIRKCNLALIYLPQSTASEVLISEEDLNKWIDEVQILRAWYHFLLVKNFGPIPFTDAPFEPDFVGWDKLTRPTYQEITNKIVSEIDEVIARERLPLRWQTSSDYGQVSTAMAYALKSRVLLYNASKLNNPSNDVAKWQSAADAATVAIQKLVPEYELLSIGDYSKLFGEAINVFNKEIILRSTNNDEGTLNNNNGVDLSYFGSAKQSANCGGVPTQELVDCFELLNGDLPVVSYNNANHTSVTLAPGYTENAGDSIYDGRDARLAHCILYNGSSYGKYKGMPATADDLIIHTYLNKLGTGFNETPLSEEEYDKRRSATGYYAKKFRSASYWGSTTGGTNAHKIYFRLAELYLNKAEALCELNKLDDAIKALDVIRLRAGQPKISDVPGFVKSKDFLMKRIRNERRVELCFEDHRFYDQRRWETLTDNSVISAMKITSSNSSDFGTFSYERVAIDLPRKATTDEYLVFPLAREEARKLPGLGQPQAWQ